MARSMPLGCPLLTRGERRNRHHDVGAPQQVCYPELLRPVASTARLELCLSAPAGVEADGCAEGPVGAWVVTRRPHLPWTPDPNWRRRVKWGSASGVPADGCELSTNSERNARTVAGSVMVQVS